jgi:hypothetical protein
VKYLSVLPATGTGARVYGRINEWVHPPADAQGVDYGPFENVTVSIRSAGLSRDVVTDRNGDYELHGVCRSERSPLRLPRHLDSARTRSGSSR